MLRTLLVDDEPDCLDVLRHLLKTHCPGAEIVGEAGTVESALHLIGRCTPDLLLLDISLKNESGFDLLKHLGAVAPQLIFVTAWDNHALRAFKYSAIDYLLKPVDGEELRAAVERAAKRAEEKGLTEKLDTLMSNLSALQHPQQKMAVPTMNGLSFISLSNVRRLEAKGSCTAIFLDSGDAIVTTRSIKEYEDLLPATIFYRVHYSHIINVNKVRKYQKGRGGYLVMEDGTPIEVAQRRREDFLQILLK
ncbi:LytTR family DNA-binding domain-containing protein [Puia sp.]|jgi:two-component system LytT family response regulator|uniref:LytR/AlgR family response regulator transcription factor n=1 Tax=Puia sp. TaxID=2045100 RepID=UPI002F412928